MFQPYSPSQSSSTAFLQHPVVAVLLAVLCCHLVAGDPSKIHPEVTEHLEKCPTTTVIVKFGQNSIEDALRGNSAIPISHSRADKGAGLIDAMIRSADESQEEVRCYLKNIMNTRRQAKIISDPEVRELWITNEIVITNADKDMVTRLSRMQNVTSIQPDRTYNGSFPEVHDIPPDHLTNSTDDHGHHRDQHKNYSFPLGKRWELTSINVPEVWEELGSSGEGIVIGVIDTGIYAQHPYLTKKLRSTHSWFDAVNSRLEPYDDKGHGTFVSCMAVGGNTSSIMGSAPGAELVVCKACDGAGVCKWSGVKACLQFMLCPTDPKGKKCDCSKKPHIVNRSFENDGGYDNDEEIKLISQIYEKTGILLTQSAGNRMGCNEIFREGADAYALTTGAAHRGVKDKMYLWSESARGPARHVGIIKPDIIAPGAHVRSCSRRGRSLIRMFAYGSGTSYAAPLVAGIGALLLSVDPNLTQEDFKTLLGSTAARVAVSKDGLSATCGNTNFTSVPNNMVGYGLVDAYAAYKKLKQRKEIRASGHDNTESDDMCGV